MPLRAAEITHVWFYLTLLTARVSAAVYVCATTRYVLLSSSGAARLIKVTPHLLACWRCGGFIMERWRQEREKERGNREWEGVEESEGDGELMS